MVRSLASQLAASPLLRPRGAYATRLAADAGALDAADNDADDAFRRAVVIPLLEMDPPERACLLVVDAPAPVNLSCFTK